MINVTRKAFKAQDPLSKYLSVPPKEDLKYISRIMEFSIPIKLKKADYVSEFCRQILEYPEKWLIGLSYQELNLLKKLVESKNNQFETSISFQKTSLEILMFIFSEEHDQKITYMIPNDLKEAVKPHLDEHIQQRKRFAEAEQLMFGIINTYGVLRFSTMMQLLSSFCERYKTPDEDSFFYLSCLFLLKLHLTFREIQGKEEMLVFSPLLLNLEQIENIFLSHPEIKHVKKHDKDFLLKMGETSNIDFSGTFAQPLYDSLYSFLKNKQKTQVLLQDVWLSLQNSIPIIHIMQRISQAINCNSEKEDMKLLDALQQFNNTCPLWINKGYSPEELSTFRAMATSTPPNPFHKEPNIDFVTAQVGRNDPCPCGSGKKYKKCCGSVN